MPTIFISSPIHPDAVTAASALGDVVLGYGDDAQRYEDVQAEIDAVILRSGRFTEAMIAASPKLQIIARHGAGVDTVDIDAATAHGVWVTNTPGSNSRSVAEHVFALALGLARKVTLASEQTRNGNWAGDRVALDGIELEGRTLGLLGQGSIGSHVATVGRALGMQVKVSDPALDQTREDVVDFDTLMREADVLSLHIPLLPATRHIINAAAIDKMKDGALLINTARGGLIDEAALAVALRSGKLAGAALDVLDAENTDMTAPLKHNSLPIADLPNLIVTPHVGGQTHESLLRVGTAAAAEVASVLAGDTPRFAVNNIVSPKAARA